MHVDDKACLLASTFNPHNPTKFLIHGFGGGIDSAVIADSKQGKICFPLVHLKKTLLIFIRYKIYNSCFEVSQCYKEWFL